MTDLSVYDNDPTLYLFTSLTAGSSHIVTATSRIETILKANKIPFKGVDTATDDLARKLYQRRESKKKLPFLVKGGYCVATLEEVEEWNEYDELEEMLDMTAGTPAIPTKPYQNFNPPAGSSTSSSIPQKDGAATKVATPSATSEQNLAIRQLGAEAAKVAASKKPAPANISTTNPLLSEKVNSPAVGTPKKTDPTSGILSPRSIPLPTTPAATNVKSPTIESNKSIPLASPTSVDSQGRRKSFAGADVEDATPEEIKKVEKEQSIAEVSTSEEEDSDEEEDGEEEEDKPKSASAEVSAPPARAVGKTDATKVEKSADDEEESSEEEEEKSSEEEKEEEEPKPKPVSAAVSAPPVGAAGKTDAAKAEKPVDNKDESNEEEEDEDEDEDEEEDEDDEGEEEESEEEVKKVEKPQAQPAKAAEKAGDSVKD